MSKANILSVATANPPYKVEQKDVRDFARIVFREHPEFLEKLLPVFTNTLIRTRYFSQPIEWFDAPHDFAEANAIFLRTATELCVQAASSAIQAAGIRAEDVAAVVYATSTGIATPSLDSHIIVQLGLPTDCKRLPMWGLGCAAGVSGLARATEIAATLAEDKCLLFVAVELCSLTFQRTDISKSNIIAASLFGDGAAAVVLASGRKGRARILNASSRLFPATEDIMGWDIVPSGLKVRFSRDIPAFISAHIPSAFSETCQHWGIASTDIQHYVLHPGGVKVLDAYCDSLHISAEQLRHSRYILENYGNMSSCSVLFVLQRFLDYQEKEATKGYGAMMALGPGFSAESILLEFL